MTKSVKFRWVKRPKKLIDNIDELDKRLLKAIHAVAAFWGVSIQNAARSNARWEDRTGNARSGIFFAVDGFGLQPIVGQVSRQAATQNTDQVTISGNENRLVITLGHTVFYGKFLELNARYGIVMSTFESNLGRLEAMLKGIMK